ncbi:MAG: flavodoxin [Cryobacterium sp.]|nr:flavodoxin [Cryobacterium sp.]
METSTAPLTALALVCTLKPSPAASSSQLIADQVLAALAEHGVTGSSRRVVDLAVRPGVEADMGEGDEWPILRKEILGNEDGAHAITAALFQGLNDVGYSIPAQGGTYWNGEAVHTVDYNQLAEVPEVTASATRGLAASAAHLAALLRLQPYPPPA